MFMIILWNKLKSAQHMYIKDPRINKVSIMPYIETTYPSKKWREGKIEVLAKIYSFHV